LFCASNPPSQLINDNVREKKFVIFIVKLN
jgi:hypothetical protein